MTKREMGRGEGAEHCGNVSGCYAPRNLWFSKDLLLNLDNSSVKLGFLQGIRRFDR